MARIHAAAVVMAVAAMSLPALASAASPVSATLACGSVITTDTTLGADVVGCVGDGLVIGADGVTLDLNGHVVSGDAVEDPLDVGIRVTGHHDVRVINGTVSGFWRGVVFESSPNGVATSLTVRLMTRRGIVFVDGSDAARVFGNLSADNQASGIAIVTSDGAAVFGNQSLRNIGGAGVRLEGATNATVASNVLNDDTFGVQMQDAVGNRIVNNTISGVELGMEVGFSSDNLVDHNTISRANGGVILESADRNAITDNQVLHSVAPDGIGIQIYGNDNLVARNTVIDSLRYGIEVDDFGDEGHRPVVGNVLRNNVVNGAELGIAIGPEAGGVVLDTQIEGNRVMNATDDGIQVLGPSTGLASTTITRNVAVHNGDLGIEAVAGTIDGGGNHAAGNGNPLQCVNVACS